ncbi:MAG: sodium-dependent transporter [Gammaproteobacteria bacterium]|nr:sodium-dependent transporter [Gammaproteobacteria bacterium]NNF61892.1 sodium-dependent transporter [Gammaproteobacteria bacterium]NNM19640.1 sodium-dependent transporter [Gammaproteobacteria bacterium]
MTTSSSNLSAERSWSSGFGFIMATVGGAIGLGNIWRFPYAVGNNGGSAFVLAYLAALLLIALPLLLAEMSVGRAGGMSAPNSLRKLARESGSSSAWVGLGWLNMLTLFLVLSFYSVIAGWTLAYVIKLGSGMLSGLEISQVEAAFTGHLGKPAQLLGWHVVTMVLTMFIVSRGVSSGIERVTSVLMPLFFTVLVGLVIYALRVGDVAAALKYLFEPDFSQLTPRVMLEAVGQAFFSVTVGTGVMLTYAAYLPKEVPLARSATIAAGADTLVALLAGLAIFPIVFAYGLDPGEGAGLIFVTLSAAFAQMSGGAVLGTVFFLLVFVAALTSCIAILEPMVARAEEIGHINRPKATLLVGGAITLFGLSTIFSFNVWQDFRPVAGRNLFELFDYFVSNICLPLGGMLYAIFAGWKLTAETTRQSLSMSDGLLFQTWRFLTRYVAPLVIAVLLVFSLTG